MDVIEKKEIVHEDHNKEYASKGLAGSALGLGIAGTALGLLAIHNRGLFGFGGGNGVAAGVVAGEALNGPSAFQAWKHTCEAQLANQKSLYEFAILSGNTRFNDRQTINSEMFGLYKSQIDADFNLYKNQRDQFDILASRISALETKAAVQDAVDPWRSKVINMEISRVADMVGLEAERRCCADNKIVNYTNSTFYPINVASITVGTTSTTRATSNPLCGCCDNDFGARGIVKK